MSQTTAVIHLDKGSLESGAAYADRPRRERAEQLESVQQREVAQRASVDRVQDVAFPGGRKKHVVAQLNVSDHICVKTSAEGDDLRRL